MIHYSCDLCGKELRGRDDARYSVCIRVERSDGRELSEHDLEEDQLEKIGKAIQQSEESGIDFDLESEPAEQRYDLCATCKSRFLKNPFNCQPASAMNFSAN